MPEIFPSNKLSNSDHASSTPTPHSKEFDSMYSSSLEDNHLENKFSQKDKNNFNKVEESEPTANRVDIILATIQQLSLTIQQQCIMTPSNASPPQSILIHKSIVFIHVNQQEQSFSFTIPNQSLAIKIAPKDNHLLIHIHSDIYNELKNHREQLLTHLKTIFDYEDIQIEISAETQKQSFNQNNSHQENKDQQEKKQEDNEDD